jgi:hypothetical protein
MKDILAKDVDKYGNEITEVVDGSSNEIRMEVQLSELKKACTVMEFTYKPME